MISCAVTALSGLLRPTSLNACTMRLATESSGLSVSVRYLSHACSALESSCLPLSGVEAVAAARLLVADFGQVGPGGRLGGVQAHGLLGGGDALVEDVVGALGAGAALERVEQAAARGASDAEQHEPAAHQDGQGQVDGLDGATPPPATEVEQHGAQSSSSGSSSACKNDQRDGPLGSKIRASTRLISYRTTSGAMAISIVNGSGVGVTTAATTAKRISA